MNEDSSQLWLILAIIAGFPVVFAGMFVVVMRILAVISGWGSLAAHFRAPPGKRVGGRIPGSGMMQAGFLPVNFGATLGVSLGEEGVGLSVLMPFSAGAMPPLLIPWNSVRRGRTGRMLMFRTFSFDTGAPGGRRVTVTVMGRAGHALAEAWEEWGGQADGAPRASAGSRA